MFGGCSSCWLAQIQKQQRVYHIPIKNKLKKIKKTARNDAVCHIKHVIAVWVLKMISSQEVKCLQITCARHLGHLQSPLGTSWRGGIRQKV